MSPQSQPTPQKTKTQGCGCGSIPFSLILLLLGLGYGGYWWLTEKQQVKLSRLLPEKLQQAMPALMSVLDYSTVEPSPVANSPNVTTPPPPSPSPSPTPSVSPQLPTPSPTPSPTPQATPQTPWHKKEIRGIYLSRYQVTNNADEATIRERVRYYKSKGFNTIIHGVWGNGCTMYQSQVMQQKLGFSSCPNQFQNQWLTWLIDEAHKQDMEVHAYFEKGIKIDKNSPIFDLAVSRKWLVPGIDKTYSDINHYVLDVEIPEIAEFFKNILVEFVQKYPEIDAVQWDDYLGYHAELPGNVDRTKHLTNFVQTLITEMKKANNTVSFDLCHHNPYWAKRYFAADWKNWNVDRVFIQSYHENDRNFRAELKYAENYQGIAISERQFNRLDELINNQNLKSILVFPISGKPKKAASKVNQLIQ
ncbi:family 10 glycosylhydrolase [Spirulina sp. CS-785/01]|uniref:family 10 glycosylhydrolase n=1 Tax=Spirulina sp. CS-785/01 TaxID=3021716 RepID=UPI00232BFC15|nr:family 10 glycosylhydrolase [Spirulina sp. CS-785/01]MDB9315934.1 family 10 glycosylhydrolase [Spirulina sp. CS-785/01]